MLGFVSALGYEIIRGKSLIVQINEAPVLVISSCNIHHHGTCHLLKQRRQACNVHLNRYSTNLHLDVLVGLCHCRSLQPS